MGPAWWVCSCAGVIRPTVRRSILRCVCVCVCVLGTGGWRPSAPPPSTGKECFPDPLGSNIRVCVCVCAWLRLKHTHINIRCCHSRDRTTNHTSLPMVTSERALVEFPRKYCDKMGHPSARMTRLTSTHTHTHTHTPLWKLVEVALCMFSSIQDVERKLSIH